MGHSSGFLAPAYNWLGRGTLAKSNAEQVTKVRRILEEIGLQVTTPDEARKMLKLKGGNNVAF